MIGSVRAKAAWLVSCLKYVYQIWRRFEDLVSSFGPDEGFG
jgi:hypothetical protein